MGKEQKQAFKKLKTAVANSILLTYTDPNKPFTYYPDASQKYAMGGLLCQMQDGQEVTVGCHSKKFTDAELKYPVGEQELNAGHKGIWYFDNIVRGCDIGMQTDHLNNTLANNSGHNLRVTRQLVELDRDYGVKITHVSRPPKYGSGRSQPPRNFG